MCFNVNTEHTHKMRFNRKIKKKTDRNEIPLLLTTYIAHIALKIYLFTSNAVYEKTILLNHFYTF